MGYKCTTKWLFILSLLSLKNKGRKNGEISSKFNQFFFKSKIIHRFQIKKQTRNFNEEKCKYYYIFIKENYIQLNQDF